MKNNHCYFTFDPIQSSMGKVQIFNKKEKKSYETFVSIDERQLYTKVGKSIPSPLADLLDLAIAVHTADRLTKRIGNGIYHFHISLPVRNDMMFEAASFKDMIQDVLYWYTDDIWEFKFIHREELGRKSELQAFLPIDFGQDKAKEVEVALWSGGLDSLAGLYQRLKACNSTHFILIGTGSSRFIHLTQEKLFRNIQWLFNERTELIQVPYSLSCPEIPRKNKHQRSRGFIFLLIGAVCAFLIGQRKLSIYENGVGAINLPFTDSEIAMDHSKSVHPISLIKMSDLLSYALETPFLIHNPFLFWTKA